MAALALVLARYTGQDDIAIGTANAGRNRPELETLVGLLVNMNVLRFDLSGDPTFGELIGRVARVIAEAHDHGEVPFAKVVERLRPPRDPSRNPLFQIAFGLVPGQLLQRVELPGVAGEIVAGDLVSAPFDIAINVLEAESAVTVQLEYAVDVFDRWRVVGLVGHLEAVLAAVAADAGLRVSQVGLLSAAERERVLAGWQGEVREYRRELVQVLVAEQAARTPGAEAVVFGDEVLSYAELEERAGAVAGVLGGLGVGAGDVVGVAECTAEQIAVAAAAARLQQAGRRLCRWIRRIRRSGWGGFWVIAGRGWR
jgi:non-ribosomal peptide synthetase component F